MQYRRYKIVAKNTHNTKLGVAFRVCRDDKEAIAEASEFLSPKRPFVYVYRADEGSSDDLVGRWCCEPATILKPEMRDWEDSEGSEAFAIPDPGDASESEEGWEL